jgi:ribosome biogenesis GTP-binding protein ylqF
MNIQWYPGHMTKAKRAMSKDVKIVDLIIEMTDARAPLATRNPDIDELGRGKARIIILNKADMAEDRANKLWEEYFKNLGYETLLMDSREKSKIKKLILVIDKACESKRERDKKKGILNRPIRAMVTGIPNVGKSTLINSIANRSMAKTGNKPGVTKGNQWIKLNKSVELLDTPGILWPKFEDEKIGEKIAFIGSINDMIIDSRVLAIELLNFFIKNKKEVLKEKFSTELEDANEILIEIAKQKGCIKKGNEYDYDKAADAFINDFRSGRLGKITLELPPN